MEGHILTTGFPLNQRFGFLLLVNSNGIHDGLQNGALWLPLAWQAQTNKTLMEGVLSPGCVCLLESCGAFKRAACQLVRA